MELNASLALAIRSSGQPVLVLGMPGDCRVFTLDRDRMVIGSGLAAEIPLRLPGVSERHILIQRSGSNFEFFDLSDAVGVLANGQRLDAGPLIHADELVVGSAHLIMVDPEADAMPPGMQLLGLPLPLLRAEAEKERDARTPQSETFGDVLLETFRRTPWLLLSAGAHALLWVALLIITRADPIAEVTPPRLSVDMAQANDPFPEPDMDPDLIDYQPELDAPIEEEEVPIDESTPVVSKEEAEAYDGEPSDPGIESALGMNGAAMGQAGKGPGRSGGGGLRSTNEALAKKVGTLRQSGLDMVIVIDTTSSMNDEIRAAKQQVATVIASLHGLGIEFRLGVVAYRDNGSTEAYVTLEEPITADVYKAVYFLDQLTSGGGGDEPEAVYEGLRAATEMKFSRDAEKILILVGDAPPHMTVSGAWDQRITRLLDRFQSKGGALHTILAEPRRIRGKSDATAKAFEYLAKLGGGEAVELRNASRLVHDVLAVTLSADAETDVASLMNDLETGRVSDSIRRRLHSHDPKFVETMLRARPLNPRLPLELSRNNHRNFLSAYLNILRDPDIDLSSRWLAQVMMRRLLVDILPGSERDWPAEIAKAVQEFDPEDRENRQKKSLATLSKSLYDAGLISPEEFER